MAIPNGYNTVPNFRYFEDIAAGVGSVGTTYYVDGNAGADTNDGLSWENAFKTLATACTASHANIAAGSTGWASRNRIYIKGDDLTEDLVALPQKTDIIGCGSRNGFKMACITGNHVPINTTVGTRFINCMFMGDASGGDIFTLASSNSFLEYWGCRFSATSTAAATGAILPTAVQFLRVENCIFEGAFSDAVIEIGAGAARGLKIRNNFIQGANAGIEIASSATCTPEIGIIENNIIRTTGICIDDDSDKFITCNNRLYSGAAKGSSGDGIIDANATLSSGNRINGSNLNNADWPALGSL
jgi:hypothetical protein